MDKVLLFAERFSSPINFKELKKVNNVPDVKEANQALLDLIYGVDESTGLPVGDLSYYLGEKANPEVKFFIESQLLKENSQPGSSMDLPNDVVNRFRELSDDDVALFSRNHDETREEYAYRLKNYFAEERVKRAEERKQREIDKLIHGVKDAS